MNNIRKNYIYNSIYQILLLIVPLITTPYLSRVLGPEKLGMFSYEFSIAYYFSLFILLGLNKYGNRTIAMCRDNKLELSRSFYSIYFMQLLIGIIIVCLYIFYAFYLSKVSIISFILLLFVVSEILDINWFFNGIEKFQLTVIRNTIIKIITTIFIFIFIKSENDIYIYSFIMSTSYLVTQAVMWFFLKKEISFYKPNIRDIVKHLKPNLLLFIPVIGVSLYKTMDKIMLGSFGQLVEVGYYEQAEKIINIPLALVISLGTVMLPRMSNIATIEKSEKYFKVIRKSVSFSMLISSSMCMGIMGISKEFVPLFFGSNYNKCIVLFLILLPSCIFLAFGNVIINQYLIPKKKDKEYIISIFTGAIINLTINLLLIPIFQSYGASIGTLFAEISVCTMQMFLIRRQINCKLLIKDSVPFIFAGIIMFIIVFFMPLGNINIVLTLFIKIIVGILVYFTIIIIYMRRNKTYYDFLINK